MIGFQLSQMARLLGAAHAGSDVFFQSVGSDTRQLQPGQLFVALQGPHFDGHDYLRQAAEAGAVAAMVSQDPAHPLPVLLVEDTRLGLGRLAAVWRGASSATLVAVTGSNGKTTVKEMIAAMLAFCGPVLATRGNLNNEIGLPLTLTRLQEQAFAVVELGANRPGEIGYLSHIARPNIAVLNNAGRAHLEGFGDLEGVARAKAEIIQGLSADGCLVLNADDSWSSLWRELASGRRIRSFGMHQAADVWSPESGLEIRWRQEHFFSRFPVTTPEGELEVELQLAGRHNQMNALAAIAAAQLAGAGPAEMRAGLERLRPVPGRLYPRAGNGGIGLIDDSYNANPESVAAAIAVLASAPGRRFLVLGELAELGPGRDACYREIGESAKRAGIDDLYAVGGAGLAADSFGAGGCRFDRLPQLIDSLSGQLQSGDRVLVKGSRSAAMERVVEALTAGEGN